MSGRFYRWQHRRAPYLFVAPFVVTFLIFGAYPLVKSFILAFKTTAGPEAQVWVGLANFRFLFTDPDFWKAVRNTVIYAAASVCLQLPLSLGLALLLNRKLVRGRNFFRLAFFSPRLVGMVFVAILFQVLFMANEGLINKALQAGADLLGIESNVLETKWLGNPELVLPAVVVTSLWLYVGFNMIYFLAALQNVDEDLYDAAKVDGAGRLAQFWHVTLPSIKPVAVFVVVLSTIGSFQLFELPYLLLNNSPGPDNAGLTIVMYLYLNGFVTGDLGYASAIGWTLVVGVMVLALVQMKLSGTWKTEKPVVAGKVGRGVPK